MLQSVVALGVISVFWVVCGFSLCFGTDLGGYGIIGDPRTYFMFDGVGGDSFIFGSNQDLAFTIPLAVFAMFQLKFAIITPALITGAFAERVRFSAYLLFMLLFSALIYCPLCHMTWHPDGKFFVWGVKDFAGGNRRAYVRRYYRSGRRHVSGSPQSPHCQRSTYARKHSLCFARNRIAVVRVVWI